MGRCGGKKAHPRSIKTPPPPSPREKKFSAAVNALLESVEADAETCGLLAVATTPNAQQAFCNRLLSKNVPKEFPRSKFATNLFAQFTSWAGQIGSTRPISTIRIPIALKYRLKEKEFVRWSKQHFIDTTGLNWKAVDKDAFLADITKYYVRSCPPGDSYPPPNVLIAESAEIEKMNHKFFYDDPLHDI